MKDVRAQGIAYAVVAMAVIGFFSYSDISNGGASTQEVMLQSLVVVCAGALGYGWGNKNAIPVVAGALGAILLAVIAYFAGSDLVFRHALPVATLSVIVGTWLALQQWGSSKSA